jgi:UDP-glucose 4-epimerase
VLIPGIAGALGRKVARLLLERGHDVIGIDARPWGSAPAEIDMHVVDIRKRAAEDVFRKRRPEAVLHMATVTSLVVSGEERNRINLGGTRAVFDHCRAYGVEHCVFVGRHTFYGAGPDAPLFHTEDEPPTAMSTFPELADLIAADLYASTALWRFPELITTVLRVCYTLGPSGHGTLAGFLRGSRVPLVMGFDPLFQFMHEDDVTEAIVQAATQRPKGVFNVAGPEPVPLSIIGRETGRPPIFLPEFVMAAALGKFGLPKLSSGALTHIKFPVTIDASRFREATHFQHRFDDAATLRAFRDAFPPRVRAA